MNCFFCGGPAHPATGCQYTATCLACHACVRTFWKWAKGWTNVKKRMPDGSYLSFYDSIMKK